MRDAARGKRIVRAIGGTVGAVILASVVALAFLYRSSQHNAADAHDRLISSYIDQGQHYLLDVAHNPAGAWALRSALSTYYEDRPLMFVFAALRDKVWPMWSQGKLRPFTFRQFALREAAAAHALMESSEHIGKILLVP